MKSSIIGDSSIVRCLLKKALFLQGSFEKEP